MARSGSASMPMLRKTTSKEKDLGNLGNVRQNVKNRVGDLATETMQMPRPTLGKPSANAVLEQFLDIPLLDTLNRINAQVGGLQKQLTRVDIQVASALNPPVSGDESKQPGGGEVAAAEEGSTTFMTGVDVVASAQEPPSKPRSTLEASTAGARGIKETKSVEALLMPESFPGTDSLELPQKLSANDLIKRVSDRWAVGLKEGEQALWERCLSSKEAQNIVKDLFWWFYCERYQTGKKSTEQEAIFKRMACNFVRLLTQVPHVQKDKFFDRFHSIMANGVYVAYRVALPESEAQFDDNFRSQLCRLAAYWTTGADIGPSSYVLPSGQIVKEDTGSEHIERVILQLVHEQAELEEMTDKRSIRHRGPMAGPNATSGTASKNTRGRSMTISGGEPLTGRKAGGGRNASAQQGGTQVQASGRKGSPSVRPSPVTGSASRENKPPPVPPLRLPVMKHTAQQYTPRTIWSERGSDMKPNAGASRSGRQVAITSRTAQRSPGRMSEGSVERRASTSRDNTSAAQIRRPHSPASVRSSSSSVRPSHRKLNAEPMSGGGKAGRRGSKNIAFDLNETSPFIRYYMSTQVTTTISARPAWKKLLSNDVMRAWDRPIPTAEPKAKKQKDSESQGFDEEEEEDEQLVEKIALTPREISEAAVKHNARMVREYWKKSQMRGKRHFNERKKLQDFYKEQREEMKGIASSDEMARVFSNLLVSTGGENKNFDTAWKKLGKDFSKDHAREVAS